MDLGYLLPTVRRNLLLFSLFVLGGIAAGFLQYSVTPASYDSTTSVIFLNHGTSVGDLADGRNFVQNIAPSYAQVARMSVVLDPVIRELGLDTTAAELSGRVTADLQPGGVVLDIGVTDSSADRAAKTANAIGAELPTSLAGLSPQGTTSYITVSTVASATVPVFPSSPRTVYSLVIGLLAGALLGLLVLALREAAGFWRVRTRQDVEHLTAEPILGSVVHDPLAAERPLPLATHPEDVRADNYRALQMNLVTVTAGARGCLVVSSASPGEGRTSTAANLAVALARAGSSVVLVDADLRQPSLAPLFGLRPERGLASVLQGRLAPADAVQPWPDVPGQRLDIVDGGPPVEAPAKLLASSAMSGLLRDLRGRYDIVVVDAPPLADGQGGAEVAAHADRALVVVSSRRTPGRRLLQALRVLRSSGVWVAGIVLHDLRSGAGRGGPEVASMVLPLSVADSVSAGVPGNAAPQSRESAADSTRPLPLADAGVRVSGGVFPVSDTTSAARRSAAVTEPGDVPEGPDA
jgi:capsular exopolysaccharide synthesis family protein